MEISIVIDTVRVRTALCPKKVIVKGSNGTVRLTAKNLNGTLQKKNNGTDRETNSDALL